METTHIIYPTTFTVNDINTIVTGVLNNGALLSNLIYLWERWADEKEYEDFNDYENNMKALFVENYPNPAIKFLSSTKRPMGFKIEISGNVFHIYLKIRGNSANLAGKRLKK